MTRTRCSLTSLFVVALLVLLLPSVAAAQDRGRFLIGVGVGTGVAGASCDDCDAVGEASVAGTFRLGLALNDRTLVGFDLNTWSKSIGGTTLDIYNLTGTITHYPTPYGLFVKAGAGGTFVDVEVDVGGTTLTGEVGSGLGLVAGVGFDIRVSRRVSVTPAVDFSYGRLGDVLLFGEILATGWSHRVLAFTIGVTFR